MLIKSIFREKVKTLIIKDLKTLEFQIYSFIKFVSHGVIIDYFPKYELSCFQLKSLFYQSQKFEKTLKMYKL
jgi:hypothetical protein